LNSDRNYITVITKYETKLAGLNTGCLQAGTYESRSYKLN